MNDVESESLATPRWGNEGRDRKALAIWRTLRQHRGAQIDEGRWLDVGCGSAGIAATLASKVREVVGVDPEPWHAWVDAMAGHPNLTLKVGTFDGPEPPLPDASIDVVVCNQVYEHVADPQALLCNIHRVLVPGGVCYFAGPNLLWPIEPHVFWPFVHWLPRQHAQTLMRALGSRQADALDAWSTHYWRLTGWFKNAGFATENAIQARILASLGPEQTQLLVTFVNSLPRIIISLITPVSPGFIFILRKHDATFRRSSNSQD